jgi:hypothetical protein
MIKISVDTNAAMMQAVINQLGANGAGYVKLYPAPRAANLATTPASASVCKMVLALPCATINSTTGAFEFVATDNLGVNGQITNAAPFTWARVFDGAGNAVQDFDARMSSATDMGQEIVVAATATFVGAFLRIASGGFSGPI